jgi:tetrahydromethanopterin S-methyltransferase subunit D
MQFINTAILLFLVNAKMKQNPVNFGLVGGSLRDFNRTWFKLIGNTIIGTMIIGILMPVVEQLT